MTLDARPVDDRIADIENQYQRKLDIFGPLPIFAKADLPSASDYLRCIIYVSDDVGGATIAFSDGSDWRRVQDRAVIA